MKSYRNLLLAGAVTSAFMGIGFSAHAEAAAASASEGATLGEVVVTARRRAESSQDVPQSVLAFDQQALTRKAVSNPFDLDKVAPGLSTDANSSSQPQFAIRGRGLSYGAAAGSVETYFADIPLSSPFRMPTLPVQTFDLQSLQVLKGPQGTLFGRNTTGGAVVLVPQAPTNDFGGYVRVQAGDFADKQFEGAINIPIVQDKVLLRASAFIWQRHGYGKTSGGLPNDANPSQILPPQDFDNQNTKEFRATLLLRPMDHLTNTTIVTYHWDKTRDTEASGWNLFGPLALPGSVALPTVAGQPAVYRNPKFGTYGTATGIDLNKPAQTAWAFINTTTYDLNPDLTVKNIFGYIRATGNGSDALDSDGSALQVIDLPLQGHANVNNQWTDELQLQGKALDGRLTYTLGGLIDTTLEPGDPLHINFSAQQFNGGIFIPQFTQSNFRSKSIYGAGSFKLTDQLTLNAGYRYSWDNVYAKVNSGGPFLTSSALFAPAGTPFVSFSKEFSGATYNADLQWRLTPQNQVYGGYRHGYKRGGFNPTTAGSGASMFGPEKVDDYFAGSKNDFTIAGMRGRLNAEVFYDKYTGAQTGYTSFGPSGFSSPVINVPETKYYGADIDFALDATDWLTVSGSYAYLHSKYGRWIDPSTPGSTIDLSVNPVTYAPEHKYSVTTRFHTELPNDLGEIALAPTVSYVSKDYTYAFSQVSPDAGDQAVYFLYSLSHPGVPFFRFNQNLFGTASNPQHTLVDLRLEWNHAWGSKVDLAVQATNLTNKFYSLGGFGGTLPFGAGSFILGPPRMIFVEAKTTF